ncbi:MAG: PLP-dependent aminotransferase family protein [Kiritimatiellia bacterium]
MKPRYRKLYDRLKASIVSGAIPPGARLPSKRTLAHEENLSVITVSHALAMLCEEGYACARERSGVFAAYRETDDGAPAAPPRPVRKAPGVNRHRIQDGFPWNDAVRKIRATLARYGERILIKSPNYGTRELQEAVADYLLRARGMKVAASQVVVGSGAEYLYGLLAQVFRGETIAIEDPAYPKIRAVYSAHGIDCEALRLASHGIESQTLASSRAQVLHVTPYRSFPTGVTADASKRREYVRWAEARDGWLIEDDFDSEFSPLRRGAETLHAIDGGKRVIYLNTFSKTMAPSMRVGYLVLPKGLARRFTERVGFYSCTVPVLDQLFLADFINDGDFERHLNRLRRLYLKRSRARASDAGVGAETPSRR